MGLCAPTAAVPQRFARRQRATDALSAALSRSPSPSLCSSPSAQAAARGRAMTDTLARVCHHLDLIPRAQLPQLSESQRRARRGAAPHRRPHSRITYLSCTSGFVSVPVPSRGLSVRSAYSSICFPSAFLLHSYESPLSPRLPKPPQHRGFVANNAIVRTSSCFLVGTDWSRARFLFALPTLSTSSYSTARSPIVA